jgi:hypothetical protein
VPRPQEHRACVVGPRGLGLAFHGAEDSLRHGEIRMGVDL